MDPIYLSSPNITYDLDLLDSQWQISLVILYSSTAILSFASNVLAIIILINRDRFTSELWKYLINLSIADIFMAIFCIPFTYTSFMLGRWIFPVWMCPVVQSAQLCSVLVSVYTLTMIGLDRYFAIIYPFHTLIYLKAHKFQILVGIWIMGLALSSVQLFQTRAIPFMNGNETHYDCKELWNDEEGKYFTIVVFVFTFGLPVLILLFVYASIGITIIRQTTPGNPDIARDLVQWNIKIKVIKMLVTIVILFVVCWLPIHIFNFVIWFYPPQLDTWNRYIIYVLSCFVSHWLSMAHSFLNPFIYGFMSENFKIRFRKQFLTPRRPHRERNSNSNSKSGTELEKFSNQTNVYKLT